MQYKTITAVFALLASAAMAMPAAAPADSGAVMARNWNWRQQFPEVKQWLPYRKNDGVWCNPEDNDYSYNVAYSSYSYVSYSYSSSSSSSGGHLQARNSGWRQQYPNVKDWLPYRRENGDWCQPEDEDYSYSFAYSSYSYVSYSYSYSNSYGNNHW